MALSSSCLEEYKPVVAMVLVQFLYVGMAVAAEAAFSEGFTPIVFIVYRQAIALLFLAPTAMLARGGNLRHLGLNMRAFCLVFVTSLVGATLNQYFYYRGMELASLPVAIALLTLVPAITFLMAASFGLEKVRVRNMRSMAKVFGTIVCIGGATCVALFKGIEVLNMGKFQNPITSVLLSISSSSDQNKNWMLGSTFLMGSTCCWSVWLLLQEYICRDYLDPLSLSTWTCLLSTFQSLFLAFFLEPSFAKWKITSFIQLLSCLFVGIFGSGVTFYLQSWSISVRGIVFTAMFHPICANISTIVPVIFLGAKPYFGRFIGAVAVISGLYIFLWGKGGDVIAADAKSKTREINSEQVLIMSVDETLIESQTDLTKPLIFTGKSLDQDVNITSVSSNNI